MKGRWFFLIALVLVCMVAAASTRELFWLNVLLIAGLIAAAGFIAH